jgi:hypothetical protein
MNKMLSGLNNETNFTQTENGAVARKTTNSECLNFFSLGGAMRGREEMAVNLFDAAWSEDKQTTLRTMFYFRDVRGGQGQREAFRKQLKHLATIAPDAVRKNLHLIPEYGRWDDLYELVGTELEQDVFNLFKRQIEDDLTNKTGNVSLLAKWLKSENTSSKKSRELAKKTRIAFGWSSKEYRKTLSALREQINIVERKITKNEWHDVDYSKVPSNAMMKYRKAFNRHDEAGFQEYINKVNSGEAKINSSTLYPYEIVKKIRSNDIDENVAQAMWDNLPDYVAGSTENSIAVVDTSGSMMGDPINVALSLGIYLAERAKGPYKDHFITFSANPELQKIVGTSLKRKVNNLSRAHWEMNTDIEAVFDLILNTAIEYDVSEDEMLDKLYIISDMEFDTAMSDGWGCNSNVNKTLMQTIKNKFDAAGVKFPQLVFWNVNARNKQFPMSMDDRGFINVSGLSPSIFEQLMNVGFVSPIDFMYGVVNSDRYKSIVV